MQEVNEKNNRNLHCALHCENVVHVVFKCWLYVLQTDKERLRCAVISIVTIEREETNERERERKGKIG